MSWLFSFETEFSLDFGWTQLWTQHAGSFSPKTPSSIFSKHFPLPFHLAHLAEAVVEEEVESSLLRFSPDTTLNTVTSPHQTVFPPQPSMSAPTLFILLRSSSSNINVQQSHEGGGGDIQQSRSEDEPHILFHEVNKPIIQEVREVISP